MIAADLESLAAPLERLSLLPGNPRRGDVDAVARSLGTFGQRKPIVAKRDGTVIAGNHTLQAARQLGWAEIAVVWVDDDDTTAKAFALADNRTAELGGYDEAELAALIGEVGSVDAELLAASGWSDDAVAELLASLEPEQLPGQIEGDPDDVPGTAPAKTIPGDVWLLGPHRLLCGDSTVPTDVEKLCANGDVAAVVTDPPYGQAQAGVPGDAPENLLAIAEGLAQAAVQVMPEGTAVVFQSPRTFPAVLDAMRSTGFKFERMLWLYKEAQNTYPWRGWLLKSEAILVLSRGAGSWVDEHPYAHDCYKLSEVSGELAAGLGWHGSVKPVAVVGDLLKRVCPPGGSVLDLFAGSGTTLIAAHTTGRLALAMELDPGYCDVICKRWQLATGVLPVAESTGNAHDFCEDDG